MTLATLRALLTLAHGPAVGLSLEDVARMWLPHVLVTAPPGIAFVSVSTGDKAWPLDLTDPGTVHAVKVALCLALAHDPGQHGISCAWRPLHNGVGIRERVGWYIDGINSETYFVRAEHTTGDTDEIVSDVIAREEDPIRALVLACEHVIKEKV